MAEDPDKEKEAEIRSILSDLDSILKDNKSAPAPTPPAAAKPPVVQPPAVKPPVVQPPAAKPPLVQPQASPPPAAAPPAETPALNIELAPRSGILGPGKPPAAPLPPKPSALPPATGKPPLEVKLPAAAPAPAPVPAPTPPPAVPPPAAAPPASAPVPAPAPAPAAAPAALPPLVAPVSAADAPPAAGPVEIPADIPKDQIRRVALLFAAGHLPVKDTFISFLDQSALTISKKPLYLRKAIIEEIKPDIDAKAFLSKLYSAHVVAALAVVEGLGDGKIRELNDALTAGGILFRVIPPGDIQKRSMAVDIIVDMLLLSPEA